MLCTIMRPMARNDGRSGLRNWIEVFLQYAGKSWGKVYHYAWSGGMTIGPVVALVLLWDERGSTSFVLTAIGLGIVIVSVLMSPTYGRPRPTT
jgi:hypothetical protein